jgi:predicted CxxxxCH...CXXCH cytochrome family protein
VNNSTATEYVFGCGNCHPNAGDHATGPANASSFQTAEIGGANLIAGDYTNGVSNGVDSKGYDFSVDGTCENMYCHSDARGNYASPTWNTTVSGACDTCHDPAYATITNLSGAHGAHINTSGMSYDCDECHGDTVTGSTSINNAALHVNKVNDIDSEMSFASNVCSSTFCHGTSSEAWTTDLSTIDDCTKCHGEQVTSVSGDKHEQAPGGSGVDTAGDTSAIDNQVGAHQAHLTNVSGYSEPVTCSNCHTEPATVDATGHIDDALPADMSWSQFAANYGDLTPSYVTETRVCSNVYCHGEKMPEGDTSGADSTPIWNDVAYLTGTPNLSGDCAQCHGGPPDDGGTHASYNNLNQCGGCHSNVRSTGFFKNTELHMDGISQSEGCYGCHGQPPSNDYTMVNAAATLGITNRTIDYSNAYGAHTIHNTSVELGCWTCHKGGKDTGGNTQHNTGGSTILNIGIIVGGTQQGVYQAPAFTNSSKYSIQGYGGTTFTQSGTSTSGDPRTCGSTYCHGTSSPRWNYLAGSGCTTCHGDATSYRDTGGSTTTTDDEVGAHARHLLATPIIANDNYIICGDCHYVPSAWDDSGHIDDAQPAEVTLAGYNATDFGNTPTSYNNSSGTCSNVYCHDTTAWTENKWAYGTGGGLENTPVWNDAGYLDGTYNDIDDCDNCHGYPPDLPHENDTDCRSCHDHVDTDQFSFDGSGNRQLHIDHVVQGSGCTACHGDPPFNSNSLVNSNAIDYGTTGRDGNYSNAWGQHTLHSSTLSMGCDECHLGGKNTGAGNQHYDNTGGSTILNMGIVVGGTQQGVYQAPDFTDSDYDIQGYGGTTFTQSGTASSGDPRTCGNTYCHGTSSPRWNDSAGSGCTICHGDATSYRDTGGSTTTTDDEVGAHAVHLQASPIANSNFISCEDCHTVPATTGQAGHIDNAQPAEVWLIGNASDFGNTPASYDGAGTCSNVYCHDTTAWGKKKYPYGTGGGLENTPVWNDDTYLDQTYNDIDDCDNCHGYPPASNHPNDTDCRSCHDHVDTDQFSFDGSGDKELHIDHVVQGAGGCNGCHGYPPMQGDSWNSLFTGDEQYDGGKGAHWKLAINGAHVNNGVLDPVTDTYSAANVQCQRCHDMSNGEPGWHKNNIINVTILNALEYAPGSPSYDGVPTETNNSTAKTCSNVNCHIGKTPRWANPGEE